MYNWPGVIDDLFYGLHFPFGFPFVPGRAHDRQADPALVWRDACGLVDRQISDLGNGGDHHPALMKNRALLAPDRFS
jgi:hypothetical protein